MLTKLIAGSLLAATLAPALAAQSPAQNAAKPAAQDEVVCTLESSTVGSHLRRRVCTTRAARDERTQRDRQTMDSYENRGGVSPGHGGGRGM